MESAFLDMAKGFGAASPVIVLLMYQLVQRGKDLEAERRERQEAQKDNIEMLRESVTMGVSLKALLERIVSKVGA